MGAARVLLVEDSERDADLVLHELRRVEIALDSRRVYSEHDLRRELEAFAPHIVLSDFVMPGFNGYAALRICREHDADLPFIFISGTVGEDVAVEAMRAGANDYLLKQSLTRLSLAVRRELRDAESRKGLRLAEVSLQRAQTLAKIGFVVTGGGGAFQSGSATLPDLLRLNADKVPTTIRDWMSLVEEPDRSAFRKACIAAAQTGKRINLSYRVRRGDGKIVHIRQIVEPFRQGTQERWLSTIQDVSEQVEAEMKVRALNRVYAVLSAINGLIVRVRTRQELFDGACRIAVEQGGFPMAWIGMLSRDLHRIEPVASAGSFPGFLDNRQNRLAFDAPPAYPGPVQLVLQTKEACVSNDVPRDPRVTLIADHAERGINSLAILPLLLGREVVGVLSLYAAEIGFFDEAEMKLLRELAGDISFAIEHIQKEEKLNYLAYYDSLTGLANRTLLIERLGQAVHAAQEAGHILGLAIVDLERFKPVNDALGRHAGDDLLRQIAARMLRLRDAADIGRVGADQFAIIIPEVRQPEELERLLSERARAVFGEPYVLAGTELRIGARAGLAVCPTDGEDAETLLHNAEAALKRAKATAAKHLFYSAEMGARVAENLALESKLRRAFEREELVLYYQQKVSAETGCIAGAEALIRWQSPELGLVPPGRFIGLMEDTGLIAAAGSWALWQAARDQRRWREAGLAAPRVAVNVSVAQLRQRSLLASLQAALREGGEQAAIDIELTESRLMECVEENIDQLKQARALGVQVSLDDFGTGHSSLAYLARLPLDAVKIDRSFVITMLSDANAMTLVQTTISLARALKLKTIAEGIDAEEQAKVLRLLRCDELQGYLFGKPVPADQFACLIRNKDAR